MTSRRPRVAALAALVFLTSLVSASTSEAEAAPVASETIGITSHTMTIGQIATVTGPVPGLFQNAADSLDAFADYINSQGGVDGRMLKVVHEDDSLDCNTYTSDLSSLTSQVFATVGTFSSVDGCGAGVLKADPTFPDIEGYLLDPTLFELPNALTPAPQPPGYPTTGARWLKSKFPTAIAHTASLYPATSADIFNEISAAYKSVGFTYVYTRAIGNTETDFTSDILRMKAEGVQIVDLASVGVSVVANFIREADQQNFHPDAIVAATGYDGNLFADLGSASANNLYMPLLYPMYLGQDRATNPELATYLHWLDHAHPGDTANIYGVAAWASGVLFVQALKAIGAHPTRSALIGAIDHITSFSADGLLPTADPGQKKAAVCMVIVGVKAHRFVRLDPTKKGFECNGSDHRISLAQASGG